MPYDLANLSTWNSLSSQSADISLGTGENLIIWHHMIITIPAELWGLITHILVYLWGLLLAGGMTEKGIISLCYYLSTFAWIFPTVPAVQFLAFAFLVQRLRHNRNRRPYELQICDKCDWHSVQDEEHILLESDCPREHLVSLRTQHRGRQLAFPPQYEDSPTRLMIFLNQPDMYGVASFVAECLALFLYFP